MQAFFVLQEIVSSKQFNENLKIFLDMTDGSEEGSDIHVVKTGEEIGDDFSDEVNPYYQKNPEKLKEDIARLQVRQSFCGFKRPNKDPLLKIRSGHYPISFLFPFRILNCLEG